MFALMPWRNVMDLPLRTETPFGWMPEEFERLFNRLVSYPVVEMPEMRYPITTE